MSESVARLKSFAYVVRTDQPTPQLLVFDSLDEPGFEVPKGAAEEDESPEQTVLREVWEEAGIAEVRIVKKLGATQWRNEAQHFFLLQAPAGLPDAFTHMVTGVGVDTGFVYRYRWLGLTPGLVGQLVQGCNAFVPALLEACTTLT